MLRFPLRTLLTAAGLLTLAGGVRAQAVPPSESLLPATTRGYVSIADYAQFDASWNKTQIGKLMQDPVMKPFADDLGNQLKAKWAGAHQRLGLAWNDLEGVPGGEFSTGFVYRTGGQPAVAVLVDVTGHVEKARALLDKVTKNLVQQGSKCSQRTVGEVCLIVFDIPKRKADGDNGVDRQAVYFLKGNLLAASDDMAVIQGIAARAAAPAQDRLCSLPAFQAVMKRCQAGSGDLAPHVRWFIDPIGYAEGMAAVAVDPRPRKGRPMWQVLKDQGFSAIQGVGGYVNFAVGKYEVVHRTAVFAPPPYVMAMKMLVLPNAASPPPPTWVPGDVATYTTMSLDVVNAFDNVGTLFDQLVGNGEPVWDDTLQSLKDDPNGPQLDLRKDLVRHLGKRVTILTDYVQPITTASERKLYAVETTNEKALAAAVNRALEGDPTAHKRQFEGHVIWEIIEEDQALPTVQVDHPGFTSIEGARAAAEPPAVGGLPNSAVAVAYGQLMVATHVDFLKKILAKRAAAESLGASADYRLVDQDIQKQQPGQTCARLFLRTDEQYRATYELIRAGKMPESETTFGRILNSMLGDGKEGVVRKQRIDGRKLPDFKVVARYLGPAGMHVTSEASGWFLVGFTLPK
ncbi:MAG: hypothetical protein ACYC35_11170 [Pirellulales bacterium]